MKNSDSRIFHGYIVELRKEHYIASLYDVMEVMLIKKDDKYYTSDMLTLSEIDINIGKFDNLEEGYYFFNVEPLEEYLRFKNSSKKRKRKKI